MLNLPLALIGGMVGVYLAGGALPVASIVGLITLFGIPTRNGIMLISHIRWVLQQEDPMTFQAAVVRSATERVVPPLHDGCRGGGGAGADCPVGS